MALLFVDTFIKVIFENNQLHLRNRAECLFNMLTINISLRIGSLFYILLFHLYVYYYLFYYNYCSAMLVCISHLKYYYYIVTTIVILARGGCRAQFPKSEVIRSLQKQKKCSIRSWKWNPYNHMSYVLISTFSFLIISPSHNIKASVLCLGGLAPVCSHLLTSALCMYVCVPQMM